MKTLWENNLILSTDENYTLEFSNTGKDEGDSPDMDE